MIVLAVVWLPYAGGYPIPYIPLSRRSPRASPRSSIIGMRNAVRRCRTIDMHHCRASTTSRAFARAKRDQRLIVRRQGRTGFVADTMKLPGRGLGQQAAGSRLSWRPMSALGQDQKPEQSGDEAGHRGGLVPMIERPADRRHGATGERLFSCCNYTPLIHRRPETDQDRGVNSRLAAVSREQLRQGSALANRHLDSTTPEACPTIKLRTGARG